LPFVAGQWKVDPDLDGVGSGQDHSAARAGDTRQGQRTSQRRGSGQELHREIVAARAKPVYATNAVPRHNLYS